MTITYLAQPHPRPADGASRPRTLVVTPCALATGQLSVVALGEVDAGNAKSFADQVCSAIADADPAVHDICLDLSGISFFAVDGCTALHAVNATVMRSGATWSVIPNRVVARVLQLCDPACLIPSAGAEELAEPA